MTPPLLSLFHDSLGLLNKNCLGSRAGVIFIPQTELAMRGSNGVGLEGAMKSARECSRIPSPIFAVIYGTW